MKYRLAEGNGECFYFIGTLPQQTLMLDCTLMLACMLVHGQPHACLEGGHEYAGVEDDGYPRGLNQADMDTSLATLRAMAEEVHAATTLLRRAAGTRKRHCAIVHVHKLCVDDVTYTDLRIAGMQCFTGTAAVASLHFRLTSKHFNIQSRLV